MTKNSKQNTLRRVKVYMLSDTWVDSGTGYCSGEIIDEKHPYLSVKSEQNQEEELLRAKIEGNIQFQRQQDTLIVWTDLEGRNIALSFQEKEGCSSLCEFIIKVQRESISPEISLVSVITNDIEGDITELITGPIRYPPISPKSSDLVIILSGLTENSNSLYFRQAITTFIKENDFIGELVRLFEENETNRKIKNLHVLCTIVNTLISFNEGLIIDLILGDENLMGILGILEYDPGYPTMKSDHRQFLKNDTKFKEILPLNNPHIESIIKKTYILQFLKDVVLARLLDDPTFNLLSSTIHFNQIEIIEFLTKDEFISKLFKLYQTSAKTTSTSNDNDILIPTNELLMKKRDGIKLLHQFVLMAKTLQPQHKTRFYKSLITRGLLKTIDFILHDDSINIRVYGTEIVVAIIEHDVLIINGVDERDKVTDNAETSDDIEEEEGFKINDYEKEDDHLLDDEYGDDEFKSESTSKSNARCALSSDMTLLKVLTKFLLEDTDPGLRLQAFEALKSLLDPVSNINSSSNIGFGSLEDNQESSLDTAAYFNAFYSQVAPLLFKPIISLKDEDEEDDELESSKKPTEYNDELFIHLCELINFCSKDRAISRSFFLENHILKGISRLIKPTHKLQLRLAAVRCLKCIVQLNDDYYTRYLIQYNLFDEVFKLFKETGGLISLVYSTVLNLLEIVLIGLEKLENRKNFKILANHIVSNFNEELSAITIVTSGIDLIKVVEDSESFMVLVENSESIDDEELDDDEIDNLSEPEILTEPLQEEDIINNEIMIKESIEKEAIVYHKVKSLLSEEKENSLVTSTDSKVDKLNVSPSTPKRASLIAASITGEQSSPSTKRTSEDVDHDLNRPDVKRKFTLKEKFANASKKIASKFSSGNDAQSAK